jgi:multiple sugar transport system substrate-binding protein
MKNNRAKKIGALLLSSVILSLTACNGGNATYQEQTLPEDDPTSEMTITFWHCLGHEKENNLQKVVSSFNTTYAGKYKVVTEKIAGDYDALHDAVKTKLAANEIPALTMGYPDSFSEYMTKNAGDSAIIKLDNYIADKKFGYTTDELNDFVPKFLDEGRHFQFDGTWSMPLYKSTEIMYYNASYFAGSNKQNKAKFASNAEFATLNSAVEGAASHPSADQLTALSTWVKANEGYVYDVPTTWEDMVSLSKKMIADRAAQNLKDEFFPVGYDSDANMMISQFEQRGIPYTVNDEASAADKSKHFAFVNDQAKAFVNDLVQLVKDKVMITKGVLGGSKFTNEYFTAGQCAMTVGSTGGSSYNVSANFKVSLAPVPYAAGKSPKYIMQGPSICFFNNGDSYIHKGAWLFYKALADVDANTKLALENSYDPIRNSCFQTTDYTSFIAKHDSDLKYDIPYHTKDLRADYMTSPVFIGSSTARTEIGKILSNIINAGLSVDNAFAGAFNTCVNAA